MSDRLPKSQAQPEPQPHPETVVAPPVESPPPAPPPVPSNDWRRLHLWQIQPVRDVLIVVSIIALVWLGYKIKLVTIPLFVAIMLAYLFEPLVVKLTRRGMFSREGVVIGVIAAVLLIVVTPLTLGVGFAIVQGVEYAGALSDDIRVVLRSVEKPEDQRLNAAIRGEAWRDIRTWLISRKKDQAAIPPTAPVSGPPDPSTSTELGEDGLPGDPLLATDSSSARLLKNIMSWTEKNAGGIASTVGKSAVGSGGQAVLAVLAMFTSIGVFIFTLLLTMFFFFFFSIGWGEVLKWGKQFIPHGGEAAGRAGEKYRWIRIIRRMDRAISGFVRGRLTICTIVGLFMTLAFWFIGAPVPLLLGPLVGAVFLVPFLPLLAVPVMILLMWLNADGEGFRSEWWWIILAPIGCHIGGQILDDYILTPKIQGDNTDLEMPAILFASLAGGALAGVYGLLLAIPVAACLKILAREFLWPRVEAWAKGEAQDFLPIARE